MNHDIESLKRYVKKKGIFYFLNPSEEDLKSFEGIIYRNGLPNISFLQKLSKA